MKRVELLFALAITLTLILGCGNNSERAGAPNMETTVSSSDTAVIWFREYEHNFGKIESGEKVSFVFTFENRGKGPLVLQSVGTSCGCAAPRYDTRPILPGKTGSVEVVFNSSGYNGMQTKTITVRSNASVPYVTLKIIAEVISSNN